MATTFIIDIAMSLDFVKHWRYEKRPNIIGAASEMQGSRKTQEDRMIFQKEIFDDVFLYAIFDGYRGDYVSDMAKKIFEKYNWNDNEFKKSLEEYPANDKSDFPQKMNTIFTDVDEQIYNASLKLLENSVKNWYKNCIKDLNDADALFLAQHSLYLMMTEPSQEHILSALKNYIIIVNAAGASDAVKQQCYKFLLAMKGSYKNIRKIIPFVEGWPAIETKQLGSERNPAGELVGSFLKDDRCKHFLSFCKRVCTETDLFQAMVAVDEYVGETLCEKFDNDGYNKSSLVPRGKTKSNKEKQKIIEILKNNGIQFNFDITSWQLEKEHKLSHYFPDKFGTQGIKIKNLDLKPFELVREDFEACDSFRIRGSRGASDEPQELKTLNQQYEKILGEESHQLILGNNMHIRFPGSTALLVFLNTKNKTIVNVNIGDSLSIIETRGKLIPLNNKLDFSFPQEQARINKMDDRGFFTARNRAYYDTVALKSPRGFGDFSYKIDCEVSFSGWIVNGDYKHSTGIFIAYGVLSQAQFSVAQLEEDAQALIIGCNSVWGPTGITTVAQIIDSFYFQKSNLNLLKKSSKKNNGMYKGVTKPLKGNLEDLSGLNIKGITNEQNLILSLAWTQNYAYPSGENISVICVDLRLMDTPQGKKTKVLKSTDEIKGDNRQNAFNDGRSNSSYKFEDWLGQAKSHGNAYIIAGLFLIAVAIIVFVVFFTLA